MATVIGANDDIRNHSHAPVRPNAPRYRWSAVGQVVSSQRWQRLVTILGRLEHVVELATKLDAYDERSSTLGDGPDTNKSFQMRCATIEDRLNYEIDLLSVAMVEDSLRRIKERKSVE